ncbi:MAG: hypothetical protein ACTSR1_09910 [Candidatus Heimdallarchaeota archaeon]
MKIGREQVKYVCMILLGANIASIILGILHYIIGLNVVVGTIFSILIVLVWLLNVTLIIFNDYKIVKNSPIGKRINRLGYGFLGVQIFAIFFLVGGLFLLNANWFSPALQYSLIWIGFFSFFVYGSLFSYLNIKALDNREVWKIE